MSIHQGERLITSPLGTAYCERIGDAAVMTASDARKMAVDRINTLTLMAKTTVPSPSLIKTPFSTLAEAVFGRFERRWKPSTMQLHRYYLKNHILPFFGDKNVASITHADVQIWFSGLSHITGTANRAAPVLSAIMQGAEELGLRKEYSNPVPGLKYYRNHPRQCALSAAKMERLGKLLDAAAKTKFTQVAILRLIILTGCRKNEIMKLCWKDCRNGHLHLIDSKTGPKIVFPSPEGKAYCTPTFDSFWRNLRLAAKLNRMRLHDFRHHYASTAIRNGESLATIGTLLGHNKASSTLKYAHFDDAMMHQAVTTITASMVNQEDAS